MTRASALFVKSKKVVQGKWIVMCLFTICSYSLNSASFLLFRVSISLFAASLATFMYWQQSFFKGQRKKKASFFKEVHDYKLFLALEILKDASFSASKRACIPCELFIFQRREFTLFFKKKKKTTKKKALCMSGKLCGLHKFSKVASSP